MAEEAITLESLLDGQSAPVKRTRAQYVALVVGLAITFALALFLLLGVLPVVAKAIAWLIEVAPRLTNGM